MAAFCCGGYGLSIVLGVLAMVFGGKGKSAYEENPTQFEESGYKSAKAGWIMGLIGIIVGALGLLFLIFYMGVIIAKEEGFDFR